MPKHLSSRTLITLCAALVAMCALAIAAQSGRHARKSAPAPPSVPEPEATPQPTPTARPTPAFTFMVGLDRYGEISRMPLNTYSALLRNCANRLDDAPSARAAVFPHDLSRAEAIRQAKAEKENYIVWLQLRPNTFSGRTGIYDDPYNVYIEYAVLAPTTAKQVTSGNVYPQAYRNKRVRLPTSDGDYYLNQAARGAAERILDHFHLRLPNTRP